MKLASQLSPLALTIAVTFPVLAEPVEVIEVRGEKPHHPTELGGADQLLRQQGVDFSAAGGVSALPVMRGMMGDRIKVLIDGADITASCANQMNPPLSYVSANQVQSAQVVAGVSPVSMGGDNIAGVIRLNTVAPQFSESEHLTWQSGSISAGYRSNSSAQVYGAEARLASDWFSLNYSSSFEDAESYEDGNGDKVLDTLYRSQNHALTLAVKDEQQQLVVKLSHQNIPFQGYPNQYMDMTNNESYGLMALYQRRFGDSEFEAQLNWQQVQHQMGFFTDEKPGMMPMETEADDYSYQLRWDIPLSTDHLLRIGHEYYDYRLNDWWPALADSMMMGPDDYLNINDGERRRITGYIESERTWSSRWETTAGLRLEQVRTNTGEVQPYNTMPGMMGMPNLDAAAADEFNTADREQDDLLVDATLLATYTLNDEQTISLGLARKNRAPNLYERYSWGRGVMATTMIGWFGDGNGYVGRIDLQPETAHTLSASFRHEAAQGNWGFELTPYYTRVNDYIDAEVVDNFSRSGEAIAKRNVLRFTNLDTELYGVDASGSWRFAQTAAYGDWQVEGRLSVTEGERTDTNEPLYQIKPVTTTLALQQNWRSFTNSLSWEWVGQKDDLDPRRFENQTDSYSILNIGSRWSSDKLTLSAQVTNLLDEYYEQPLGGVSIAEFNQDNAQGFQQLAGAGRSINFAVSYVF